MKPRSARKDQGEKDIGWSYAESAMKLTGLGFWLRMAYLVSRQALLFIPLCPKGWPQERPCNGFSAELEVSEDIRS